MSIPERAMYYIAVISLCVCYMRVFGSFGLSTKEPCYTIMLCPSLALALPSSYVHTSPSDRVTHQNFIFGIHTWHRVVCRTSPVGQADQKVCNLMKVLHFL